MSDAAAVNEMNDLIRRLRSSCGWVAAQYWAGLLLLFAGIAWTRLPDKHTWQVGLTLMVPVVLLALALLLQAGTMRGLLGEERGRAPLITAAVTLLVWVAVVGFAWWLLDWCNDQIPVWAGYLNSRASARGRATILTYEHIQLWLTYLVWILRWVVVPAKVIPHAMASAKWGWRLPWLRVWRMLLNWQWWLAVAAAALLAVEWPSRFFIGEPHGTVRHQVWAVILKLAGGYLLGVTAWILLLAWAAVLLARGIRGSENPGDDALVGVPVNSGPLNEDSVRLPLPEGGDGAGGNA